MLFNDYYLIALYYNVIMYIFLRFVSSFNRPNLVYEVVPKNGKSTLIDIAKLINSKFLRQSGIIYCMTKKECDNAAMILSRKGIRAVSYHAGLSDKKRNDVQMQWSSNKANVIKIVMS